MPCTRANSRQANPTTCAINTSAKSLKPLTVLNALKRFCRKPTARRSCTLCLKAINCSKACSMSSLSPPASSFSASRCRLGKSCGSVSRRVSKSSSISMGVEVISCASHALWVNNCTKRSATAGFSASNAKYALRPAMACKNAINRRAQASIFAREHGCFNASAHSIGTTLSMRERPRALQLCTAALSAKPIRACQSSTLIAPGFALSKIDSRFGPVNICQVAAACACASSACSSLSRAVLNALTAPSALKMVLVD